MSAVFIETGNHYVFCNWRAWYK